MKWLTPKCPVTDEEKDWLEESGAWLLREFSIQIDNVRVVLPTPEFFPDTYRGEEEDVRTLLGRVCSYMGVNADRLSLDLFSDEQKEMRNHLPSFESSRRSPAGLYREGEDIIRISLSTDHLSDPMTMVAVIAHELGHVLLLADQKIARKRNSFSWSRHLHRKFSFSIYAMERWI
jgi:hypothetical protein